MIYKLEHNNFDSSLDRIKFDPAGMKIHTLFQAYGQYNFADFWIQNYDGLNSAYISKLDGDITICLIDSSTDSLEELYDFINILDYKSIFANSDSLKRFGVDFRKGGFMRRRADASVNIYNSYSESDIDKNPALNSVYQTLSNCDELNISFAGYEAWYADISHRIRHKLSRAWNFQKKAVIMTSAETDRSAMISGVCVKKEFRNKGIGAFLIDKFVLDLLNEGKSVFLCSSEKKLESFYAKLSFVKISNWFLYPQ